MAFLLDHPIHTKQLCHRFLQNNVLYSHVLLFLIVQEGPGAAQGLKGCFLEHSELIHGVEVNTRFLLDETLENLIIIVQSELVLFVHIK